MGTHGGDLRDLRVTSMGPVVMRNRSERLGVGHLDIGLNIGCSSPLLGGILKVDLFCSLAIPTNSADREHRGSIRATENSALLDAVRATAICLAIAPGSRGRDPSFGTP